MATRIDQALITSLEAPAKGYHLIFDNEVRGFAVRITAKGTIAFVMDYRTSGRQRRMTIGTYPEWKPARARKRAEEIRRAIQDGQDPMAERHETRDAPTVTDLWKRYETDHLPRKRLQSQANDRRMWEHDIIKPLGKMKMADVRFSDIDRLHHAISKRAPTTANRVVALLSKMFSLAIKWEWRMDNPCRGVEKNSEESRERILSFDELSRLSEALDKINDNSANAIRLLILTGARKGEVLSATWGQFDLEAGNWVKPSSHTKQKREHKVPLSAPAIELLSDIKEDDAQQDDFVFPSRGIKTPHLTEIKKAWASACKRANIEGVRLHDLRHTFASLLASSGQSLPLIGQLLGHTQASTTKRYAHFYDDPLRAATERVGSLVTSKGGAEVLDMKGGSK